MRRWAVGVIVTLAVIALTLAVGYAVGVNAPADACNTRPNPDLVNAVWRGLQCALQQAVQWVPS